MAQDDGSKGSADPAAGYEDQDLAERMRHGLTVDRRANNAWSWFTGQMWKSMGSKNSLLPSGSALFYRSNRNTQWWTKRQANAKLAGKTNMHKQIVLSGYAVMLDLIADRRPTVKDWKTLADKDDRQTRRAREYLPHVVHDANPAYRLVLYQQDGSRTIIPPEDPRKGSGDGRTGQITTPYSSQGMGRNGFDLKVFSDCAYIKRQRAFWEDALEGLSRWRDDGNAILKDSEWIVRHMVNNDIAMHVIFDNISLEYEARWFDGLGDEAKIEVAGGFCHVPPYAQGETDAGPNEASNSARADSLSPGKGAKVDYRPIPLTEDADGCLHMPDQMGMYIPPAITDEDAAKAVDEMVAFVSNFEEKVPDNLRGYMVDQDRIEYRMQDLLLEAMAELGMSSFAEERSAANSMLLRFHEQFCRSQRRPGS